MGRMRSEYIERVWSGIRKPVVIQCLVIVFGGLFVESRIDANYPLSVSFGLKALDAIIIAALLVILAQLPGFKDFLEERLSRKFTETATYLIKADFIERCRDLGFLRSLDRSARHQAEDALMRANYNGAVPNEVDGLHTALRTIREQTAIWRSDLRYVLVYEDYPQRGELLQFTSDISWKYHNYSGSEYSLNQRVTDRVGTIQGVASEDLFKVLAFDVDRRSWLSDFKAKVELDDGRWNFDGELGTLVIPAMGSGHSKSPVAIHYKARYVKQRGQPYIVRFFYAVHNIEITVYHPDAIKPMLHLFATDPGRNLIEPLETSEDPQPGCHRWQYHGWLLPSQGFVITFAAL